MSTRQKEPKIRLDQHELWPILRKYGYENLAHETVSKNAWIHKSPDDIVQTPKQHAVYMFECEDQCTLITWYPASNLVTVNNGRLYYMYHEYHQLFPAYAWLAASETTAAEYLTVKNTPMTYEINRGQLTLRGVHINRHTGEHVNTGYSFNQESISRCAEVHPKIPWYAKGIQYAKDFDAYLHPAEHERFSNKILTIQRWWKTELKHRKPHKMALWVLCRNLGQFTHLCDDLFAAIIDHALRVSQPRQLQCEFPRLYRPEVL